ncbi:type II secretion system protein [Niveibacterium sp. SC-1]|uniref:type II secretion system protein n=1 Tax=Niveibacterium sp. SC-1 TaxID=3135646 RepID=UPI00311D3160
MRFRQRGFTLIELAIALLVVSVLAGGMLLSLRAQYAQRQLNETRVALDEAREALLAYAAATGHLPCPTVEGAPGNGQEQREPSGNCTRPRGLLPWETLGLRATDGWNQRLAYQVSPAFMREGIDLESSEGNILVRGAGGVSLAADTAVAAAVWSLGNNGAYATQPSGVRHPGPGGGSDEQTNDPATTSLRLIAREGSDAANVGGAFDDHVIWISRFVLFGKMLSAGRLP